MFHDEKGTWMIMFWTTVSSLWIGSLLYNLALEAIISVEEYSRYQITPYIGYAYHFTLDSYKLIF